MIDLYCFVQNDVGGNLTRGPSSQLFEDLDDLVATFMSNGQSASFAQSVVSSLKTLGLIFRHCPGINMEPILILISLQQSQVRRIHKMTCEERMMMRRPRMRHLPLLNAQFASTRLTSLSSRPVRTWAVLSACPMSFRGAKDLLIQRSLMELIVYVSQHQCLSHLPVSVDDIETGSAQESISHFRSLIHRFETILSQRYCIL